MVRIELWNFFEVSSSRLFKGIDELLSKHIAHIFIRDPLVIFSETIDQDDETSNDHFEVSTVLPLRHSKLIVLVRISNLQIGKLSVSNRRHPNPPLVGESSSVAWKYS